MNSNLRKKIFIFSFLLFPTLLLLIFFIWPTLRMTFLSFTNWDGTLPKYDFVGIKNYTNVLTDGKLWISLRNNGVYALAAILQNVLSLFFAVILSTKMRGKTFYKVVIFMPFVINITAIAYMFNFMYDYNEGPINLFLKSIGLAPVKFLGSKSIAIYPLVSMSVWRWLGYSMVIYIAALQSIDPELYEAASIDGSSSWESFRFITLPSIKRIVQLQLFMALSGAFQAFTETLVLTKGGPGDATYTFMYYIIQTYTYFNNYGLAAAASVLLVFIILLIAGAQRLVVKGGGQYNV